MRIALACLLSAALIVVILSDPATFQASAAHAAPPAPAWQTAIAFTQIVLLLAALHRFLGRERVWATRMLLVEVALSLGLSMALLNRHGLSRFAVDFGHYEGLSIYLSTLILRILLLCTYLPARESLPRVNTIE
jgi:hypothetical protein